MEEDPFIPLRHERVSPEVMTERSRVCLATMSRRRSVRDFSDEPVAKEVIRNILMIAASSPSGAHKQPWSFCAVSSPAVKKEIRIAAEKEERKNYLNRMSQSWLDDLAPLGTTWEKPFLEIAPWLIVVFKKAFDQSSDGTRKKNYYVNESVGLATGFLLTAIHQAGLVSLTHTPSPMNFLEKILQRPSNERAYLLLPVGHPALKAQVPDLKRKGEDEVIQWYE